VRVSFAGELGWELHYQGRGHGSDLRRRLGGRPKTRAETVRHVCAGFAAARKGLPRLEGDLSTDYTILQGGLERFVKWDKPDFKGKAALANEKQQGVDQEVRHAGDRQSRPLRRALHVDGVARRQDRRRNAVGRLGPPGRQVDRARHAESRNLPSRERPRTVEVEIFGERFKAIVQKDEPLWDPANEQGARRPAMASAVEGLAAAMQAGLSDQGAPRLRSGAFEAVAHLPLAARMVNCTGSRLPALGGTMPTGIEKEPSLQAGVPSTRFCARGEGQSAAIGEGVLRTRTSPACARSKTIGGLTCLTPSSRISGIIPSGKDGWEVHFSAMTRQQAGEDIIMLSVGDHDFDTPSETVEAACHGWCAPATTTTRSCPACRVCARRWRRSRRAAPAIDNRQRSHRHAGRPGGALCGGAGDA
jgi:hypothetical protein